jgi:hypothetical protein
MNIARRALILYVAGILALAVYFLLFRNPMTALFKEAFFYLLPLTILLIGLVIGWFGTMIIQYSKWIRSFYIFGLNLSFILFLALLGYIHIQNWLKDRRYGYDSTGRDMLQDNDKAGKRYVANGFEKLQGTFSDPHQVHLIEVFATHRDTTIRSEKDTIRTVYYLYFLRKDSATIYFAKVELNKEDATVIAADQLPASDTPFLHLHKDLSDWQEERLDSIISLLKSIK